jgi:hypothetical protein
LRRFIQSLDGMQRRGTGGSQMGFYIRKALKVGPFRFNLSRSGIGISAGIKGLRLGAGPRGNYIHMGRGGLYFRQSLNPASDRRGAHAGRRSPTPNSQLVPEEAGAPATVGLLQEIESESVEKMVDASSAELLLEMNEKRKKPRLLPATIVVTLIVLVLLLLGAANAGSELLLWVVLPVGVLGGVLCLLAAFKDELRKTTVIMYDLEPEAEAAYAKLHDAFTVLKSCCRAWHIEAQAQVRNAKYHAGAGSVLRRTSINVSVGAPPFVKCNVDAPLIPAGKQMLAFMPDRLLVFEATSVGAIDYRDLTATYDESRFIEEESVPRDATIVGHTWRYVNKNGGPDRRFKNNSEIPICLYDQIRLASSTGLNEIIQLSKQGACAAFRSAIWTLQHLGNSKST